jgi:hypothetical protein
MVIPSGRSYITSLETMLGVCSDHPFIPHHPVRHINNDLKWWEQKLNSPAIECSITHPPKLFDIHGFSNMSTSVGIAIVINGYWRV